MQLFKSSIFQLLNVLSSYQLSKCDNALIGFIILSEKLYYLNLKALQ